MNPLRRQDNGVFLHGVRVPVDIHDEWVPTIERVARALFAYEREVYEFNGDPVVWIDYIPEAAVAVAAIKEQA